jgi:hypothetical protein
MKLFTVLLFAVPALAAVVEDIAMPQQETVVDEVIISNEEDRDLVRYKYCGIPSAHRRWNVCISISHLCIICC